MPRFDEIYNDDNATQADYEFLESDLRRSLLLVVDPRKSKLRAFYNCAILRFSCSDARRFIIQFIGQFNKEGSSVCTKLWKYRVAST